MDYKGSCFGQQETDVEIKTDDPTSIASYSSSKYVIKGNVVVVQAPGKSGPGKSAFVQVYSSTSLDPRTGKGKLSSQAYLHRGKSKKMHNGAKVTTNKIKIFVAPDFGIPGAFLMKSNHKHEFFLESASFVVPDGRTFHFDCRSWVYPFQMTKQERVFFSNASYLPNQTPITLAELRKAELSNLRESGSGERKEWDRIYDYDYYNDLGDPSKGLEGIRPVLGGSKEYPYPRKGGTGTSTRSLSGMINLDAYVPPDERLSQFRLSEIIASSIQASLRFLIPATKHLLEDSSCNLESFEDMTDLFTSKRNQVIEENLEKILKKLVPDHILKKLIHASKETHIKPPLPQIIAENELAWRSDEEFGRQMLAGANPTRISSLQMFPPQGKNGASTMKASDIETNLDGLTLVQAMNEWRMFILDHHDYLMPFLSRININDVCAYASRTLLFLRSDNTQKPVAIELSLPGSSKDKEISRVFHPASQGTEAAIWQMAKAHVAANDSAYHQLVSHWLHTHAVIEPIVIATRRQLSIMHPIYRLLDPHFKGTMHINALARRILLNAGGIFEKTLYSREVSMELSSELYKEWRFDEQGLPIDLIKRGLAIEDPESPTGVQLVFQDYPYGADGLDIWQAIKTWVFDFCRVFYTDNDSVKSDKEIQAWWSEVRNVGHGDKCNSTGWWRMTTLCHLIDALTTIIWITSAHHAAINFGQYAYYGCPLNRPTLCRKFVPEEGTHEYAEFLTDPDKYFLNMLPERFEMTLGIALADVLSKHATEEMYLGQRTSDWTDNKEVEEKFKRFQQELLEIEKKIFARNADPELKNRRGPANRPYELLLPSRNVARSNMCLVGKGIPNSISI